MTLGTLLLGLVCGYALVLYEEDKAEKEYLKRKQKGPF